MLLFWSPYFHYNILVLRNNIDSANSIRYLAVRKFSAKKTHLERLKVDAEGATVLGSISASLQHSGLLRGGRWNGVEKALKNTKKKIFLN